MTTRHKKYRKRARILYRAIIVVCVLALILAIVALYLIGKLD